jgi:hypothetical protein
MRLATRVGLKAEQVAESDAVQKVKEGGKKVAHVAAETSGFIAWTLAKLFRPVVKRVRSAYAQYREELNQKE